MSSTLSARTQQRRIQIAKKKALRGIPVGINVLSIYDNTDKVYWQHINDVRKYCIRHNVECNQYMSSMREEFSSEIIKKFFDFVYDAVLLNLKDAKDSSKEERIEGSFQRAIDYAKFAFAQANDYPIPLYNAMRSRLLEFKDKANRELNLVLDIPDFIESGPLPLMPM